jgi:hypothetical protein
MLAELVSQSLLPIGWRCYMTLVYYYEKTTNGHGNL